MSKLLYTRFTKLIIDYILSHNKSIPRRSDSKLHSSQDDQPITKLLNMTKSDYKFGMEVPDAIISDAIRKKEGYTYYMAKKVEIANVTDKLKKDVVPGKTRSLTIAEETVVDFDGMEHSILAKVKDLSVITDLLKYMCSEGFIDVGLRYVGGRWVWLEFDSTDQVESVKNLKGDVNELFYWRLKRESLHRVLESFKVSYRNRYYCITATELAYWAPNIESTEDKSMIDSLERKDYEGPSLDGGSEHEEPLDVDNCDSFSSKYDNNDLVLSSEMSSTSRLMREVDVRGVDSDHVDSFEEGLYGKNFGRCVGKKILRVRDFEFNFDGDRGNDTIEDNADLNPSTNVYLDVNQNTCIPEVVEDLSYLDKSSDKAERLALYQ
ncbi:hypothetical protein Tco_0566246 [Tanacetum coccineum]